MKALLACFAAGVVSACGFEPIGWWPLTLAALAVLLWLVERAPSLRGALARGYWFGVGNFVLGLNWIATAFTFQSNMPAWLGWIAVVLLSLYIAVYPAMAAGLAWRWGRQNRLRFVLLFAAAWIVTEWLRATMFTGFAWNPLGVALLPTSASWSAPLIGTYGLSGVALLLAGALLLVVRRDLRRALALFGGIAALSLIAAATRADVLPRPAIALRIVQPNIGQQDKWKPGFEEANFSRLQRLSATTDPRPRLLLWPEASVTEPLQDGRRDLATRLDVLAVRQRVARLLGPRDLLLLGGIAFNARDGVRVDSGRNSVFAMDARGRILGRYDKAHLVPYGEYLPARPILSRIGLSRLSPGTLDYESGPGPRTLDLPLIGKVGVQLCYEIIFSGEVVDKRNRPNFLFNPSNDAWFGRFGPPQHLAQAQLRALEEGLPVLRSTPTGISAVVDAEGRLLASLPWRRPGKIDAMLPLPKPPTPFARWGNILSFIFALLLVGIGFALRRKAR